MNTIIEEEILDIVDENNNILFQQKRTEYYKNLQNKAGYLRAATAFVRNSKGQLWIPRRTKNKTTFPLGLDASVSGHVSAGESYYDAFVRETAEEINITIPTTPYRDFGIFGPQEGLFAFSAAYIIDCEHVDNYNQEDFCECFWLYPQEILERIKNGDQMKTDPHRILELLQDVL
jgi:8-oxo-dGTP pyrophosphatase MutT (NUDIX family)